MEPISSSTLESLSSLHLQKGLEMTPNTFSADCLDLSEKAQLELDKLGSWIADLKEMPEQLPAAYEREQERGNLFTVLTTRLAEEVAPFLFERPA